MEEETTPVDETEDHHIPIEDSDHKKGNGNNGERKRGGKTEEAEILIEDGFLN